MNIDVSMFRAAGTNEETGDWVRNGAHWLRHDGASFASKPQQLVRRRFGAYFFNLPKNTKSAARAILASLGGSAPNRIGKCPKFPLAIQDGCRS
jgi:hypothetical protein